MGFPSGLRDGVSIVYGVGFRVRGLGFYMP